MNAPLTSFFGSREDDIKNRFANILKELNPHEIRPIQTAIMPQNKTMAQIRRRSDSIRLEVHPKFFQLPQQIQERILKHEALHATGYARHDWMFRSAAQRHGTAVSLGELFGVPIKVYAEDAGKQKRMIGSFRDQEEARDFAHKIARTDKTIRKIRLKQTVPTEFREFFYL